MTLLVYDAGALIAADRNRSDFWLMHDRAIERGVEPVVPATVLTQVRRGPTQHGLAKLMRVCRVAALDRQTAELAGDLLGIAARSDIADAHVVVCCLTFAATCVTSDDGDIRHLAAAARGDRAGRFGRRKLAIVHI